ncbi:hypothetical protein ACFYTC_46860 [Actinomadura nitritigenes]|uniref:hypothetical protein n=1 Tax=Actinomadura nitritigenes TaxID=134602 RepID=UPI003689D485
MTARSVRRWKHAWQQGGGDALRSKDPVSVERLSAQQWSWQERELKRGPLVHGFDDEAFEVWKAEVWPPKGRTRAPRGAAAGGAGARPGGCGRANISGVVCYRTGHRRTSTGPT